MKRRNWFTVLALVMSLSLLLVACGGGNTSGTEGDSASPSSGEEAAGGGSSDNTSGESSTPQVVDSLQLTMGGASPGGFWSLIGEGIGSILTEAIPNTQYSYETGNGVSNAIKVAGGEFPLGLAHNFEIKAGLNGDEPYPEKLSQVTALATVYNNAPQQMIISKDFADKYGIASMDDIAEKKPPIRVAVNQKGNLTEAIIRNTFEAYGFTYDDIKSWGGEIYYEPYKPAADMMKDNKVDWFAAPVFAPDGKILELATSKDLMILSMNEKAQQLLQDRMGIPTGTIPDGTYDWQTGEIQTVNAAAIVMADPNMSVDEAYTLTKTLVENIDKIQSLHKLLQVLTPETMADVSPATLHPGAEAYYKEAGILQ